MRRQGTLQNVERLPAATMIGEEGTTMHPTEMRLEDLILVHPAGTNEMTGWKGHGLAGTLRTLQHDLEEVLKTEAT
jgi:hypothetical protein